NVYLGAMIYQIGHRLRGVDNRYMERRSAALVVVRVLWVVAGKGRVRAAFEQLPNQFGVASCRCVKGRRASYLRAKIDGDDTVQLVKRRAVAIVSSGIQQLGAIGLFIGPPACCEQAEREQGEEREPYRFASGHGVNGSSAPFGAGWGSG